MLERERSEGEMHLDGEIADMKLMDEKIDHLEDSFKWAEHPKPKPKA